MEITSRQNPKIKEIVHLRRPRSRSELDRFIVEGFREISHAANSSYHLESLFICEGFFLNKNEHILIDKLKSQGVQVYICSESVFEKIAYRERPDGLLAIAQRKSNGIECLENVLVGKKNPLIVVAESIEKPGNLGTILRSCDGVGVDAVVVCDPKTDIYNPNVVRASIGCLFTQPVVQTTSEELLTFLQKEKIAIVATTPHTDVVYTDEDLTGRIAILVGTEQYGLSDFWIKAANIQIKIPMRGSADSLNVATATTIVLYEALRQRTLS